MSVQGIVLLLCAIRSMLWYRFLGPGHFIIHGCQIAAGIILGLLGLLNIGNKHGQFAVLEDDPEHHSQNVNPMYQLTMVGAPLIVIMGVYLITYLGSTCAMTWIQWRKGGIYQDEDEDKEKDDGQGSTGTEEAGLHHD